MLPNTELLPLVPQFTVPPAPPAPTVTVYEVPAVKDKAVSKVPPPPVAVTVERSPPAPPPPPLENPPPAPPAITK
jgi:hypothetical protein